MASLLLAVIYVAFISLGLPDSLLGSAWPTMSQDLNVPVAWAGGISAVISMFTIVSALLSDRMTLKFGAGKVTAVSVALTAAALAGFSVTSNYWVLLAIAIPYGLGAGGVDAALNNYVAIHYESRHMSWLHCMWGRRRIGRPLHHGLCALSRPRLAVGLSVHRDPAGDADRHPGAEPAAVEETWRNCGRRIDR